MNRYRAFYKGRELDVDATTALEARDKAAKLLKARKAYDVAVVALVVNGQALVHTADF
jgi:hypothetical protein